MIDEFIEYSFSSILWKNDGPGGWFFVSVPQSISIKIRELHQDSEEGWGRLKAILETGKEKWDSAIWFDSKMDCYLVPIKKEIRKKENLVDGSKISLKIIISV